MYVSYVPEDVPTFAELEKSRIWRIRFCVFLFALLALILFGDVAEAQTITQQPASTSVPAGQTATFSVAFTGGTCSSVWYTGIGNFYGPRGASPISYSIPNVTLSMNGIFVEVILYGCTGGTLDPLSSQATLTVTPSVPLVSITITPSAPTVAVGSLQAFTAVGTYADNSTQNITTSATWTSDTPSVLTILANGGVATGVAVGAANISATLAGITSSVPVTVDLSSVTLAINTTANTNGKANSALLFDTGAAILPGPIVVNQTAGSMTLPAGTVTSDANGNLSGQLTVNANPQYLVSGNVVLTFGLSIIPNAISYPVPASEFSHGATGLTLNLVLYKNNLDIKSQTIGFTP